jgi:formylglycine-generating enzyme required for sulfatase activity
MRNTLAGALSALLAGVGVALVGAVLRSSELAAQSSRQAGETWTNPRDGMVFVWIPGGEFQMGDASSGKSDERPVHRVRVEGFWLGKFEVTNQQYAKALQAWGNLAGLIPSFWRDPQFNGTANGKINRDLANYRGRGEGNQRDRFDQPAPVGSFPPNPWGVCDLAGNVDEWVSSLYKPYPFRPDDGRENPNDPGRRVFRGGSWAGGTGGLTSTARNGFPPTHSSYCVGFRCARSP